MRILLIDEDPALKKQLSSFLESHGFEVCSSNDALQALDLVDLSAVDMIIADVMAPAVDGVHPLDLLKADPKHKGVPIIVTSSGADEGADLSMRKGAAFCLPKPIDLDRLLALVRFAE